MLLLGKDEILANFRKKTKVIGEMIIPSLFLLTGIGMILKGGEMYTQSWIWIKLVAVILIVVLGIITFKKNNKILGIITLLLFIYVVMISYRKNPMLTKNTDNIKIDETSIKTASTDVEKGKIIYVNFNCAMCHGENGDKPIGGAKDLTLSQASDETIHSNIMNGKNAMPPFKDKLNDEQLNMLTAYIKSMRK
jgi:cytochrome c553